MTSQQRTGPPVLVPLAAEIDIANCEQACDQLSVAFIGGAAVVIADFPAPRIPTPPGREVP